MKIKTSKQKNFEIIKTLKKQKKKKRDPFGSLDFKC